MRIARRRAAVGVLAGIGALGALGGLVSRSSAGRLEDMKRLVGDDVELDGLWLYDDLPAALAKGKKDARPILAVVRCPH